MICSFTGHRKIIPAHKKRIFDLLSRAIEYAYNEGCRTFLSGGAIGTHVQMGIGDGIIPAVLNQSIYDDVCIVKDDEAIQASKDLASKEGIMCGISSGTNVAAAIRLAKKLGKGKTVVTVLPDTAERYFSTPLFD